LSNFATVDTPAFPGRCVFLLFLLLNGIMPHLLYGGRPFPCYGCRLSDHSLFFSEVEEAAGEHLVALFLFSTPLSDGLQVPSFFRWSRVNSVFSLLFAPPRLLLWSLRWRSRRSLIPNPLSSFPAARKALASSFPESKVAPLFPYSPYRKFDRRT